MATARRQPTPRRPSVAPVVGGQSRGGGGREAAIRTFLIADIRGYTSFTAQRGDEAASQLAAKFAEVATEGAEAWGGRLLELRGDEALAVFDSARQALRAAVELQAAFAAETTIESQLPLRVGIGLDAGEAVAVGDGYRGAALNLAARLCSAAVAGQVIASQNLVHLAGPLKDLEYTELGPTALKGIAEDVPAVSVRGTSAVAVPAEPAAETPPQAPLPAELDPIVPLAGRQSELRWLSWHWRRAGHGAGRAVVVSGPPGIGKTRLATELAASVHAGGANVSYLPAASGIGALELAQLDSGTAGLIIVDDLDAASAAVARQVASLARAVEGHRALLLVTHREQAATTLAKLVDGFTSAEQRHQLGPLDLDAVRPIAALYAGRAVDELPLAQIMEESGGLPAAIHRLASAWARRSAAERLASSAQSTSAGRRGLRTAEAELIGNVADLELARERTELYGADRPPDELAPSTARLDVCPYKGLAAFEAADAEYYFGRERLVAELVARLVGASFLGLVGSSGSGKSSALRAGLLPALAGGVLPGSDAWPQVLLRPGETPMIELGRALAGALPGHDLPADDPVASIDAVLGGLPAGARLVVVVDQFEEIFNAARDEAERRAFVDLLTTERPGLKVVVALRADYYGHCAAYPDLARLIGTSQVLVGPLTRAELSAVIEHPAQRVGLRVEPGLTESLLDDIGEEPGALPLLSTALLELWQARDRGRLTLAAYHATGGVRGAVARLAEAAYGALDENQRQIARSILLRLAGPGEGEGVVRRRVSLAELDVESDAQSAAVLARLTDARLLTSGEGYVEVAHEALLREWPRVQQWLEEDSAGRALRLHLIGATADWDQRGREPGDLYRGARLAAALDWGAEHRVELNESERAFLEESRLASEREQERQRRANRRLRFLLAGAGVFLVVAIAAGTYAALEAGRAEREAVSALAAQQEADGARHEAEQERDAAQHARDRAEREEARAEEEALRAESEAIRAEEQARLARSRELAASAISVLDDDPQLSLLLALQAIDAGGMLLPEAVTALHRAVQNSRSLVDIELEDGSTPEIGMALSPDGQRLYVATDSRSVGVYDVATKSRIDTLGTPQPDSADHLLGLALWKGERLAYVDEDAVIHIWDLAARTEQQIQAPGVGTVKPPAFGPDGRSLAVLTYESTERDPYRLILTVWRLDTGEKVTEWGPEALADFVEVHFHPDGNRLLVASCACNSPGEVRWFHIDSGEIHPTGIAGTFSGAAVSPEGTLIATAGSDRTAKLWDAETGELVRTFRGHGDVTGSVAFSADGRLLASTASDGTTRIWDVESDGDPSGVQVALLAGQGGLQGRAMFSETGAVLATSSSNSTVRLWDVTRTRAGEVAGHDLGFSRIFAIEQAGHRAAIYGRKCPSGCFTGDAVILDLRNGATERLTDRTGLSAGLSHDGQTLFTQRGDAEDDTRPWWGPIDAISLEPSGANYQLQGICPNSFEDGMKQCGEPPLTPYDEQVGRFAFAADGTLMAMAGNSQSVSLWDPRDGTLTASIPGRWLGQEVGIEVFGVALSRDGSLLAVGTLAHGVMVLETATVIANYSAALELESRLAAVPSLDITDEERDDLIVQISGQITELLGDVRSYPAVGIWRLQFTPDNTRLAVASPFQTMVLDLASGEPLHEMVPSWDLDLSSDGTRMVTMNTDGFVRLSEVESGREIQAIPTVTYGLGPLEGAVRFADDERYILTADAGMLLIMAADTDELVRIARSRLTRTLTDAECNKYLHVETCPEA